MRIAFVIYDGLTLLDFAGAYDPVSRLRTMGFVKDLEYDVCARKEKVRSFEGIDLIANKVNPDLSTYDYVFIPGGNGIQSLMGDGEFLGWIAAKPERTVLAAVCGGSLLLGAIGRLRNKRATTHPAFAGILARYAREVSEDRIVDEGDVITAGGVTASLDLGLYVCQRIAGLDVRRAIQKQMDYRSFTMK
jgi:cyclohexyl-isocyanide hydratase